MKNMIKLPAIVLGLLLMLTGSTQKAMAQGEDVSMQSFYDELSPYGTWIQDSQYGYVWRPDVEQGDFRPYYTNGRWAMTEYGNTWVSNYDWGWAPFHYGRWVYNSYNQWVWIPDTTWGPAWVSWRSGGGYYGWAPMGPGMNVNINFSIPDLWWVFIPQRNIYYNTFPRYYSRRNVTIIHNTTIINNTYVNNRRTYYTGPRADDIRRVTRQDVTVYNLNNTTRPSRSNISGRDLNMYTPRPSRGSVNANARPKEAIRGDGYATARPDRNSATSRPTNTNGAATSRPSRGNNQGNTNSGNVNPSRDNRTGTTNGTAEGRPMQNNNSRPSRTQPREVTGSQSERPERVGSTRETPVQRPQPTQTAPQQQPQRAERPQRSEQTTRPERAQRPVQRAEPPAQQSRPVQPQPQRQERPAPAPAQRPQTQRPERTPQSVQPSRSSGSQGGGRTESSRPSRGTRG